MKLFQKSLVIAVMLLISAGAYSQSTKFDLLGKLGYQTDAKRFGIEMGGRYEFAPSLRVAPAVSFWFPKNDVLGFNVDVNLQYAFAIPSTALDFYPLIGLNMSNNSYSGDYKDEMKELGIGTKKTDWGFNVGFGADYHLTSSDYLNFEFKYAFGGDFATFMIGYGYKF